MDYDAAPAMASSTTILLAGRRYPAAQVTCPPRHPRDDFRQLRLTATHVPCENGTLFCVETFDGGATYNLNIYSQHCELVDVGDGPFWLPVTLMVDTDARQLVPWRQRAYPWDFTGCDPEWAAESIDRWGRWPVIGVDRSAPIVSLGGFGK